MGVGCWACFLVWVLLSLLGLLGLLVASLLASWGGEICFSSFPFSLRYFLELSLGFFCGPCMALAVSWGLRSSEPRGWLWCFGVCFLFLC